MTLIPIEKIWQALIVRGRSAWPIYQRVDEMHPLDLYAGISSGGARLLMLVSAAEPSELPSYHAFEVSKALRQDGRWTITVELRRAEFANIFGHLCDNLIDAARTECKSEEAAVYVIARIQRWQKLLGRDRKDLLDINEIRGLIGELLFLERISCVAKGLDAGVRSWEGPLDAPQDFRFQRQFVEVKTCGPSSLEVSISSAEQLDTSALPIVIAIAVIEPADALVAGSFTLTGLVEKVRQSLVESRTAVAAFEEKLKLGGYTERQEYTKDRFAFRKFRYFAASGEFPKLERRLLPEAIVSLKYELDLSNCRSFERESAGI